MTPPRAVVCAVVSVHVAGVVGNSLFPVHLGKSTDLSWWEWPNLVPLVGYEARDMLEKVVVLVPLGVLLPLVARVTSLPRVLVCGFLISLTIELLQWVNDVTVHGGHIPDIDDLLFNTAGTPIGYGLFRIALLCPSSIDWRAAPPGRLRARTRQTRRRRRRSLRPAAELRPGDLPRASPRGRGVAVRARHASEQGGRRCTAEAVR